MFTTGLRAGDLAMTGIAGLRPIGQVLGACVSHSNFIHGNGQMTGSPGKVYLYPEAVATIRTTRKQALNRMTRDAVALGADAVVGIQVSYKERRWDDRDRYGGLVESVTSGIAVTWQDRPPKVGEPVLTNLDMQGYWKLVQCGYVPAGMVMSTVMTGCLARRLRTAGSSVNPLGSRQWSADRYPDAAAMVIVGYRTMNEEIREQGLAMGAEGIIGVEFQRRTWGYEFATRLSGIPCRQFKMILTAVGTAIVPARNEHGTARRKQHLLSLGAQAASGEHDRSAAPQTGLRITPVRNVT